MQQLVELLKTIVTHLVDQPDQIRISVLPPSENPEDSRRIEVYVAPDDFGKVLGKEGRLASGTRSIVKASARKYQLGRIAIEFLKNKSSEVAS